MKVKGIKIKKLVSLLSILFLPALSAFLISGRWNWWEAWVMLGLSLAATLISRGIVIVKHPDLAAERSQYSEKKGIQEWDRKLMPIVAIYGPLLTWIVAGLDKKLGGTAPLPLALELIAMLVVGLGYAFSSWALVANTFFAAVVRIQKERGHTVITDGPYRFVRHPGYSGSLVSSLAAPFAFGAIWALIPAGLTIFVLIIRTLLEDRFLQEELPGYREYAQKTRYRLLPGIW